MAETTLNQRVTAAVDVLKAAIADRYGMVTIENRFGRGIVGTDDVKRKALAALALDILTGEQTDGVVPEFYRPASPVCPK